MKSCRVSGFVIGCVALSGVYASAVLAQRMDVFVASRDHPAIEYSKGPVTDRVAELNRGLEEGRVRLTFEESTGYLRSTLQNLKVPVESQVAVFAQNSFQAPRINLKNPRTLFFGDAVAVGYVRGGTVLELAAHDPRQGVIFYTLDQTATETPRFTRNDGCLACHLSWTTLGVPGLFVFSIQNVPDDKNSYANGFASDHRSTFDNRWGGWYVTGSLGSIMHIGNKPVSTANTLDTVKPERHEVTSLDTLFDTTGYASPHSDVAALMVLEHQTHMINEIIHMGWEARLAAADPRADSPKRLQQAATDLVDYLLFVYEVPLPNKVRGSSGFTETFAALGPSDSKGRSLRQLDLDRRLLRYPCSYLIYSEAFDALPDTAKSLVYRRLWQVLSGQDRDKKYNALSAADRQAILEILRATKKGLPDYFS